MKKLVGAARFELATPCSQSRMPSESTYSSGFLDCSKSLFCLLCVDRVSVDFLLHGHHVVTMNGDRVVALESPARSSRSGPWTRLDRDTPGMSLAFSSPKGFGLRVETSGTKILIRSVIHRVCGGCKLPEAASVTIGRHGRSHAGASAEKASATPPGVAGGGDPAWDRSAGTQRPTVQSLFEDFSEWTAEPKLKPKTAETYRSAFSSTSFRSSDGQAPDDFSRRFIEAAFELVENFCKLCLTAVSAMYGGGAQGFAQKEHNPALGI